MKESCIRCEKDIPPIQLICDQCANVLFTENIFWLAPDPVIGGPNTDRSVHRSEPVLTIGGHPDGDLIYRDGEPIMDIVSHLKSASREGKMGISEILGRLHDILLDMGVSEDMGRCFFSPGDFQVFAEIFYVVEDLSDRGGEEHGALYRNIAHLLEHTACKSDSPIFSPSFRERIRTDLMSEALRYCDMAGEEDDIEYLLTRGNILLKMGREDEAKELFENILLMDNKNMDAGVYLARIRIREKDLEGAEGILNDLLDTHGESAMVWYLKGEVMREKGSWGGAVQFYDLAMSKDEGMVEAYTSKARVLLENGMIEEANAVLDTALELDEKSAEAWFLRSNILREMDRWGGAVQCLNEVLDIDPHLGDAWVLKGDILSDRNLFEEAFEAYETALMVAPELKYVIEKKKVYEDRTR